MVSQYLTLPPKCLTLHARTAVLSVTGEFAETSANASVVDGSGVRAHIPLQVFAVANKNGDSVLQYFCVSERYDGLSRRPRFRIPVPSGW